ncbi:MAG: xanthine dehydrogenase family protein subunit M [Candidatus Krumholzibacteria bacterium]|nr:xanthine dehydrogenase family protein subunit M [Candidatus Krumholzibacteria bacterium]
MYIPDVRLHEPGTIAEACGLLKRYGGVSRILAGGTDLLVDLKQGRLTGIEHLVSISKIDGLRSIEDRKDSIRIGALVTLNEASGDEKIMELFPALVDAIGSMAAFPVRNMATVAGNIAGAVPSSDLVPFFVAAGGEAVLSSGESERSVRVADYIVGPRETVCGECEMLISLVIPKPLPRTGISYRKFMLRGANALAVAGVAASITLEEGAKEAISESCIVLTAVAPRPLIAREAGEHLKGKPTSRELFKEAAKIARRSAQPISDIRGTDRYRYELVEVLSLRALEEALARALAGGD